MLNFLNNFKKILRRLTLRRVLILPVQASPCLDREYKIFNIWGNYLNITQHFFLAF